MILLEKIESYSVTKGYKRFFLETGSFQAKGFYENMGYQVTCTLYDFPKGNVYRQSLADILEKNQDELLFNYEIKGSCSGCKDYKSVCIGCRADAYHYTGDVRAANPKCFKNPDAKEYYSSPGNKPPIHANERE